MKTGDVSVEVAAIMKFLFCNLIKQKMFMKNIIQWDTAGI